MLKYTVVHVKPDKTEEEIYSTDRADYARFVANGSNYDGAWLTDTRKLLRHRKGEIQIRIVKLLDEDEVIIQQPTEPEPPKEPRVYRSEIVPLGNRLILQLHVSYHPDLKTIWINEYTINGFNINKEPIWQTSNFTALAEITGKEIAFQCMKHYEDYLRDLGLKGAM